MRPRILYYCQYLVGIGHMVRSAEVIRHLVQDCDVCLIGGGQSVPDFPFPDGVELVNLPELWVDGNELKALDEDAELEDVKADRRCQLLACFDRFKPDIVVTEMFPFSKVKLAYEVVDLLDHIQSTRPQTRVVCSLRDIFLANSLDSPGRDRKEKMMLDWANRYYDLILHHGDPTLQPMASCFSRVDQLTCEVFETGLVVQTPPSSDRMSADDAAALARPEPKIVVSAGGGRFGHDLVQACVGAARLLCHVIPHHFHVFAGPFLNEPEFAGFQRSVADQSNVTLRRFTPHLIDFMRSADLSISLGGYNTTMNILGTGVRALVFPQAPPYQTAEQTIRATKLEKMGLLDIIWPQLLSHYSVAQLIVDALKKPPATHSLDLRGAERSAARLVKLLRSGDGQATVAKDLSLGRNVARVETP